MLLCDTVSAVQLRCQKLREFELPADVIPGYLAGLAASSVGLFAIPSIIGFVLSVAELPPATALPSSAPSPLIFVIIPFGLIFLSLFIFVYALFFTLPTFLVFWAIASVYRIESWAYYLASGAIMGIPIALLFSRGYLSANPLVALCNLCSCGALGGMVFWWIAVRRGRVMHKLK